MLHVRNNNRMRFVYFKKIEVLWYLLTMEVSAEWLWHFNTCVSVLVLFENKNKITCDFDGMTVASVHPTVIL